MTSTKHIALAVNEELTLHTRLLVGVVDLFPVYSIYNLAFNTIFPSLLYSGWLRRACGCNKFPYAGLFSNLKIGGSQLIVIIFYFISNKTSD